MNEMRNSPWAATLTLSHQERLENRILAIAQHMTATTTEGTWSVDDIDATGALGSRFTAQVNETIPAKLTTSEFLSLLREDGQIIELDTRFEREGLLLLRVIVRDGTSVDIIGTGTPLSADILGSHTAMDPGLFLSDA
ncbi:hypothetical protein ACMHYB_57870 [Sorangium sp. So ce1128]